MPSPGAAGKSLAAEGKNHAWDLQTQENPASAGDAFRVRRLSTQPRISTTGKEIGRLYFAQPPHSPVHPWPSVTEGKGDGGRGGQPGNLPPNGNFSFCVCLLYTRPPFCPRGVLFPRAMTTRRSGANLPEAGTAERAFLGFVDALETPPLPEDRSLGESAEEKGVDIAYARARMVCCCSRPRVTAEITDPVPLFPGKTHRASSLLGAVGPPDGNTRVLCGGRPGISSRLHK